MQLRAGASNAAGLSDGPEVSKVFQIERWHPFITQFLSDD
jgi:hypothetical protein